MSGIISIHFYSHIKRWDNIRSSNLASVQGFNRQVNRYIFLCTKIAVHGLRFIIISKSNLFMTLGLDRMAMGKRIQGDNYSFFSKLKQILNVWFCSICNPNWKSFFLMLLWGWYYRGKKVRIHSVLDIFPQNY